MREDAGPAVPPDEAARVRLGAGAAPRPMC